MRTAGSLKFHPADLQVRVDPDAPALTTGRICISLRRHKTVARLSLLSPPQPPLLGRWGRKAPFWHPEVEKVPELWALFGADEK